MSLRNIQLVTQVGTKKRFTKSLPFGILIFKLLLRNNRLRENIWLSPLLPKRLRWEGLLRKRIVGCCLSLIWIKYGKQEGFRQEPASQKFTRHVCSLFLNYTHFWNLRPLCCFLQTVIYTQCLPSGLWNFHAYVSPPCARINVNLSLLIWLLAELEELRR